MDRFLSPLLSRYQTADQELRLKARFILISTLCMIAAVMVMLVFAALVGGVTAKTFLFEAAGSIILLVSLATLVRGHFSLAVHAILITGFSVTWLIMFNDPSGSNIMRLDSIVFIVGILAAMPMLLFKDRRPMALYFLANLALLLFFIFHLRSTTEIPVHELVDYAMDNTVVICFVFSISIGLYTINRQVMAAMTKELAERKKAEHNLQNMRVLLSNTINAMPSVIVGVNREYQILLWNKAATDLSDIFEAEAENRSLFSLLPQLKPYRKTVQEVMDRQVVSHKFKLPLSFGSNCHVVDMTVFPIATIRGAVIRLDDISQRLRMEELVIQSEKMLSLGGLAAGMAHEINNPLAGMIQTTQLIENRIRQDTPANIKAADSLGLTMDHICAYMTLREIPKLVTNIREAGLRAAGIIENMLDFARQSPGEKAPHDLSVIMEEAVTLARNEYDLKKKYDFKNIHIQKEFHCGLPMVPCDKGKIQQVLFNILKNAAQAMAAAAALPEAPCIILRAYPDKGRICMEIEDNGPGMPREIQNRIFEPFFTTKPQGQGTGLGLSVSYFIITEDHGGTLTVDSKPGKGTCFTICLPCPQTA